MTENNIWSRNLISLLRFQSRPKNIETILNCCQCCNLHQLLYSERHYSFVVLGKTYRLRISNVGLQSTLNFRIQGHKMKLVEVEGTHTIQTTYSELDIHVGQSYSVLITADQPAQDYFIAVSNRFSTRLITTTGTLRYSNSKRPVSGPIPGGPTTQIDWSIRQARSIR